MSRFNKKSKGATNCSGCGIELQTTDAKKQGYVPKDALKGKKEASCQRCFKISNYGSYLPMEMTKEDYRDEVAKAVSKTKVALAVFDIIDFEGSFDDEILDVLREMDSIIAVNKIDLIPGDKHPSEVSDWVKRRLAEEGIVPLDIAIISAKSNYGVNGIIRKLNHFFPRGAGVVVMGTTNVGKSSIINGLLGNNKVTTSKYPGTTLKSVVNKIPQTDLTLVDTPGLIPEGRISDMVCQECNLSIVPSKEISRMTFKLKPNRVLLFGGLMWLKVLEMEPEIVDGEEKIGQPIFTAFASKGVTFHETNEDRVADMISAHTGGILAPPCNHCKDEYSKLNFKKETWTLDTNEELVFKGLGWLSVKRGPLKIEVNLPEDAEVVLRDAFITPKRAK